MKYLISLLLLSLFAHASIKEFAQKQGYYTNYKEALKVAQDTHKPMMLVMVTHYCPWCRKLERHTLSKSAVNSAVKKDFVPLILNRERDTFPEAFRTPRIPVVFFVDYESEEGYWESAGFLPKETFLEVLQEAKKLFDKRH